MFYSLVKTQLQDMADNGSVHSKIKLDEKLNYHWPEIQIYAVRSVSVPQGHCLP